MILRIIAICAMLLLFRQVQAEGGCPPGYYPHNVPGLRGCAPIPGYSDAKTWIDGYGAVVWWSTTDGSPQYAYSSKYLDQASAEREAVKRCRLAGGNDCSVAFTAINSFIVVARNDEGRYLAISDGQVKVAEMKLLADCSERDSRCEIVEVIDSQGWYEGSAR